MHKALIALVLVALLCPAIGHAGSGSRRSAEQRRWGWAWHFVEDPIRLRARGLEGERAIAGEFVEVRGSTLVLESDGRKVSRSFEKLGQIEEKVDGRWYPLDPARKKGMITASKKLPAARKAYASYRGSIGFGVVGLPFWVGGVGLLAGHPPMLGRQISDRSGLIVMPTPAAIGLFSTGLVFEAISWGLARAAYDRRPYSGDVSGGLPAVAIVLGVVGLIVSGATIGSAFGTGGYEPGHAPPTILGAALCTSAGLMLTLDAHRLRNATEPDWHPPRW